MATFAVTLAHGARWKAGQGPREQAVWAEHAAFMDALVDDGFIIIGGPLPGGALLAVECEDESAARRRLAADPWAQAGLLTVISVQPWPLWLDSRKAPAQPV